MNDAENKINLEIIRRAVKQSELREQEKEELLGRKDIIEALEEITSLSRLELENIAQEVSESFAQGGKDFFSIKHQVLLATLMGFIFVGVIALPAWLL